MRQHGRGEGNDNRGRAQNGNQEENAKSERFLGGLDAVKLGRRAEVYPAGYSRRGTQGARMVLGRPCFSPGRAGASRSHRTALP